MKFAYHGFFHMIFMKSNLVLLGQVNDLRRRSLSHSPPKQRLQQSTWRQIDLGTIFGPRRSGDIASYVFFLYVR